MRPTAPPSPVARVPHRATMGPTMIASTGNRGLLSRRELLQLCAAVPLFSASRLALRAAGGEGADRRPRRLLYTSAGKTFLAEDGGQAPRPLEVSAPDQVTWQPGAFLSDGRLVMLSMEARRDGPGKPFEEYYTQTPTHLWIHDLTSGKLEEICTKERLAVFYTPALLLSDERILVQVVRNRVGQIYSMRLDGSDAREFTRAGEGLPYGLSASPDGKRVAFHLASPEGYQIWTSAPDGTDRVKVAADPAHLYFGTSWSPSGRQVLFVDCQFRNDPGHDWCDVCVGQADGSGHRVLTEGQSMWFAATYGSPETRGGGSNLPGWTRAGRILFPRRLPGSQVPWEYQAGRPDVDHFNREYRPQRARGGTEIVSLDPETGSVTRLTSSDPPVWDFRAAESPDGQRIVFARAATGEAPALWLMNADGSSPVILTRGVASRGADHPRWAP